MIEITTTMIGKMITIMIAVIIEVIIKNQIHIMRRLKKTNA